MLQMSGPYILGHLPAAVGHGMILLDWPRHGRREQVQGLRRNAVHDEAALALKGRPAKVMADLP